MKALFLTLTLLVSTQALAKTSVDLNKSFDSLGGNRDLTERAKALDPNNQVQVVQNRTVDRHNRLELGLNSSVVAGGDPYISTYNLGADLNYHISPRWSTGVRYYHSYNDLTADGQAMYDAAVANAKAGHDYSINQIDYPSDTVLAMVEWYPVYGKLNLFNQGVAQFDLYVLGGYGKVELVSGWTDTYTAGGGVGLWLTQHITTRLEGRWQGYQDQLYTGPRQLNLTIITLGLGFLL